MSHYVWIYSLAEALALSLVFTTLFGIKWWNLRRDRKKLDLTCKAIAGMLKEGIVELTQKPTTRPELREIQIAYLKALSIPFRKRQLSEKEVWENVLDNLEQRFDDLKRTTRGAPEFSSKALKTSTDGSESNLGETNDTEEFPAEELDSGVDALLAQYLSGASAIRTNREATIELKKNYKELQLANRNLRQKLQVEKNSELWNLFGTYEQSNAAFMKTLSVKERSYNILVKEYESLQEHIHDLKVSIANYRKSVHKLLLEKSALTEENKQLVEQQEAANTLVARLNRNYDTLRNEYTKLFETTR